MYTDLFLRLFRGRGDARGSWEGGAIREPLTPLHFAAHLHHDRASEWIGVYNVIDEMCSWGCVDIDVDDFPLASNVHRALELRDIPSWIEKTTRGFHIWVFPEDLLVPAHVMRRSLTAACRAVGYAPKEVFPKQDSASGRHLGNYVRLPLNGAYCGRWLSQTRRFVDDPTLVDMDHQRAHSAHLEAVAALLPRPQRVDISVDLDAGLDSAELVERFGGLVQRMWTKGPRDGEDRSTTLARLAHRCRDAGADQAETLAIISSADERWGKRFAERGEPGLVLLRKIVVNAWRGYAGIS